MRQEDQVEEVVATAVLPVLHILPDMAVDPLQQQEGATVVLPRLPGMAKEMLGREKEKTGKLMMK